MKLNLERFPPTPRHFGLVDYKVMEAEYFLDHLSGFETSPSFLEIQFCASAFAAAARSITFSMQAVKAQIPGFDTWYVPRQKALKEDELARFFHDFRTVTQKIGATLITSGSFEQRKATYYFHPCTDLTTVPKTDVVTACTSYYKTVLRLVYDCYSHFGPTIDPQQYFTEEHFASMGKALDDATEEVGFPRGWLRVPNWPDEYAWQQIRRQAGGIQIQSQFEKWLGLRIRHPDDTDEEIAPWLPKSSDSRQ